MALVLHQCKCLGKRSLCPTLTLLTGDSFFFRKQVSKQESSLGVISFPQNYFLLLEVKGPVPWVSCLSLWPEGSPTQAPLSNTTVALIFSAIHLWLRADYLGEFIILFHILETSFSELFWREICWKHTKPSLELKKTSKIQLLKVYSQRDSIGEVAKTYC